MKKNHRILSILAVCILLVFVSADLTYAGKPTPGESNSINVPRKTQEHSNWCWDGSSQAVLYYFGQTPSQCQIANFAWNRSDCCSSNQFNWNHVCNSGNYLFGRRGSCDDVLANWGIGSTGVNGALSWTSVKSEIDNGMPYIMGWYWTGGGGHALVGYGYSVKSNTQYMSYMDPWPGEGFTTSTYSYVVNASDHQWGQTLKSK